MIRSKAFTLIELLIVVAIIGILAAIAVPNFLNARTRAKVARVQSDMRAFAVALDSYNIDNNNWPWGGKADINGSVNTTGGLYELTSPVAYMASVGIEDPFGAGSWGPGTDKFKKAYTYVHYMGWWMVAGGSYGYIPDKIQIHGFGLASFGPDQFDSWGVWAPIRHRLNEPLLSLKSENGAILYNASNGLVSKGDIGRYGGDAALTTAGG